MSPKYLAPSTRRGVAPERTLKPARMDRKCSHCGGTLVVRCTSDGDSEARIISTAATAPVPRRCSAPWHQGCRRCPDLPHGSVARRRQDIRLPSVFHRDPDRRRRAPWHSICLPIRACRACRHDRGPASLSVSNILTGSARPEAAKTGKLATDQITTASVVRMDRCDIIG